eukprot:3340913-Rhodomonas_salina.1
MGSGVQLFSSKGKAMGSPAEDSSAYIIFDFRSDPRPILFSPPRTSCAGIRQLQKFDCKLTRIACLVPPVKSLSESGDSITLPTPRSYYSRESWERLRLTLGDILIAVKGRKHLTGRFKPLCELWSAFA